MKKVLFNSIIILIFVLVLIFSFFYVLNNYHSPMCNDLCKIELESDIVKINGEYFKINKGRFNNIFDNYIINNSNIETNKYISEYIILNNTFVLAINELNLNPTIFENRYNDYILYDGRIYGDNYVDIDDLILFNDSFAFIGETSFGNKEIVYLDRVLYSGDEIGGSLVNVNGSLSWYGYFNNTRVIFFNGKVVSNNYLWANGPANVLGNLAYYIRDEKDKSMVVYENEIYLDDFDETYTPFEFNNSLAYLAEKNNKKYVVLNRTIYCECEDMNLRCVNDYNEIIGC